MTEKPTYRELEQKVKALEKRDSDQNISRQRQSLALLDLLVKSQKQFIQGDDRHQIFDNLLNFLLEYSKSEYGFIGEVFYENDGTTYQLSRAISNISWDRETRRYYEENWNDGLRFESSDTLFGIVTKTGRFVIANDVPNDPRSKGVPAGHPALKSFLGVPILHKDRVIGSFGIANRPDGYDSELVDELQPFVATCSVIISALKLAAEREEAEAKLKESEERFRVITENSGDGIALLGGDPIRIKYVNRAMSQIFGYTSEELYAMSIDTFMDILVPEHRKVAVERLQNRLAGKDVAKRFEYQIIRKNGHVGWIELYADSVDIGGERCTLAGYRDITKNKKSEKHALMLRAAIDQAPVGIALADENISIYYCNPEGLGMRGGNEKELVEIRKDAFKNWQVFKLNGEPYKVEDLPLVRAIKKGETIRENFIVRHQDGTNHICDAFACPVLENTKIMGGMVIFLDITEQKRAEDALRKSEELLSETTRQIPGVLYQFYARQDGTRGFYYISERSKSIVGLEPHLDGYFERFAEMIIPEHREDFIKSIEQSVNEISPWHYEGMLQKPTGERIWFSGNSFPSARENEVVFNGIVLDISERKQAEEKLRKKDAMLANISSQIPGMIYQFMMKPDGSFSVPYSSDGVIGIFGCSPEDVKNDFNPIFKAIHPEDRELILQTVDRSAKSMSQWKCEYRVQIPGGPVKWIYGRSIPEKMDDGSIVWSGYNVDISDRKQAELRLKENEQRLISAQHIAQMGDFIWDVDTGEVRWSEALLDLLGYDRSETIDYAKLNREIHHPDDLERVTRWLNGCIASGREKLTPNEYRVVRKNGTILYVRTEGIIEHHKGKSTQVFATIQDITKRKLAEREKQQLELRLMQAQKMESIGSLAGGIAHDFNNILFPIIGLSEMLMEDLDPGSAYHENAEEIYKAGKRGSGLVKQILTFSRQSEQKKLPVRIQQVLKEVMKLIRSTIPSYVKISSDIRGDCGLVLADPTQIHQVAMNLITNAYHAVETTNGEIAVALREIEAGAEAPPDSNLLPKNYVLLSVSDTGVGIPKDIMHKIFDPYFTTKEQGKGTGLGLAVVYGIIKEHGGDIKAFSEPGKGTTFKVYLPVIDKASTSSLADDRKEAPTGHEHILLVDDEEPIAKLEKQILERLGYQVTMRVSSLDALEAFKARPDSIDLVISDMTMPNIAGDQLVSKLMEIRPDIPVIICTGFSERLNRETAESLGIKGFLMKPIVKAEMAAMVRKVLDAAK